MAFSRALGVIGIVTVSWLAAVGCDDDDGKKVEPGAGGGEGGEAPAGGKSSAGGSSSNGGGGKTSGGGGTSSAGDGGAGLGGATPVVDGGAGGEPVTPSGGAAGDGGAGGEAGASNALTLKQCGNECNSTPDCAVAGSEFQKVCDLEKHRCVVPGAAPCTTSDECAPTVNQWAVCGVDTPCVDDGSVCAVWNGKSYCIYPPNDGCLPGEEVMDLPQFGSDAMVQVCVGAAACNGQHECQPGCEAFGCDAGNGATCSSATHLCECTLNEECSSNICGSDHQCKQCATSQDCVGGITGLDTCVDGTCGCSSAAVCPDLAAGQAVCE